MIANWRRSEWVGWAALLMTAGAFHVVAFLYVRWFYESRLPFYDSVGSYTAMFDIMNRYHDHGVVAGAAAAAGFFLSWTQSFFALAIAPFAAANPQNTTAHNTLALAIFMAAIYRAARAAGAGPYKSYALSLLVFLPDGLWEHAGGYFDMRRDAAFLCLIGATFFSLFAFEWRPSRSAALWLGVCAALTVLSRDNASALLLIIIGPPAAAAVLLEARRAGWPGLRRFALPLVTFAILIAPYFLLAHRQSMQRAVDPYLRWGYGDDVWASVAHYWHLPLRVTFGHLERHSNGMAGTLFVTLGILALIVLAATALWLWGFTTFDRHALPRGRAAAFIGSGLWASVALLLLICVVFKLKPAVGYPQALFPFFPSMLMFLAPLFVLGLSLQAQPGRWVVPNLFRFGVAAVVLGLAVVRVELRTPDANAHDVKVTRRLVDLLADRSDSTRVAWMTHETVDMATMRFYLSQRGRRGPVPFRYTAPDGATVDLAAAVPPGADVPALLEALREGLARDADIVVLDRTPSAYRKRSHHQILEAHGQPIVDWVRTSGLFRPVLEYQLRGRPFLVLERRPEVAPGAAPRR